MNKLRKRLNGGFSPAIRLNLQTDELADVPVERYEFGIYSIERTRTRILDQLNDALKGVMLLGNRRCPFLKLSLHDPVMTSQVTNSKSSEVLGCCISGVILLLYYIQKLIGAFV